MQKLNQKGIGHVAVVLVILVIGAAGFAGWRVWDNKKDKESKAADSQSQVTSSPEETKEPAIPKDWKTYTSEKEGFSISYPPTWKYKNTTSHNAFDSFTITGPKGFVIQGVIASIPLDGGETEREVVFVDEVTKANYGTPLYSVGHYNKEFNNADRISVTTQKYNIGIVQEGPRGYFPSHIEEIRGQSGTQKLSNFVLLEGSFPLYKTAEGIDASPAHVDFSTNSDLVEARSILKTLTYKK